MSDFCLELHSHKSQKTTVLKSIENRLISKYNDVQTFGTVIDEINQKKKELKEYVELINQNFGNFGCTIFDILWKAERYQNISSYLTFKVPDIHANSYLRYQEMVNAVEQYRLLHQNYDLKESCWKGFDTHGVNFSDKDDFLHLLNSMKEC